LNLGRLKLQREDIMLDRRQLLAGAAASAFFVDSARAENAPGVTDKEIKIGQTMPYSGPASAYGVIGKAEAAYFRMVNEQGGINGRTINLISLDDAYSPPKTVEQVRRLVEQEQVAFLFNTLGTAPNLAIRDYCNQNKVPQLYVATGASAFSDPEHFKWTTGFNPDYRTEARIYGKHIVATKPQAKIAVLYQNDGFGKDYLLGLKEGLGAVNEGMIVKEASYETSEPTIDSQVVTLCGSGAEVLVFAATPKFAAQAIRKSADLGFAGVRYITNVSVSIASVLKPAGLEKAKGLLTATYLKDVTDPRWKDDPDTKLWSDFCDKYLTHAAFADVNAAYGMVAASVLAQALRQCGDNLSRENILAQATSLKGFHTALMLPEQTLNTSPTQYNPFSQMQLATFNGQSWDLMGDLIKA
jgi:branched-chain amino acid transport system substrate-binding protein